MRRAAAARVAVRTRSSSSTPLFRLWLSSFSPAAFFEPPHPTARDADEGFGVSADRIRRGARDATRRSRGTGRELSHDESRPVLRSRRQARSRRRARGRLGQHWVTANWSTGFACSRVPEMAGSNGSGSCWPRRPRDRCRFRVQQALSRFGDWGVRRGCWWCAGWPTTRRVSSRRHLFFGQQPLCSPPFSAY